MFFLSHYINLWSRDPYICISSGINPYWGHHRPRDLPPYGHSRGRPWAQRAEGADKGRRPAPVPCGDHSGAKCWAAAKLAPCDVSTDISLPGGRSLPTRSPHRPPSIPRAPWPASWVLSSILLCKLNWGLPAEYFRSDWWLSSTVLQIVLSGLLQSTSGQTGGCPLQCFRSYWLVSCRVLRARLVALYGASDRIGGSPADYCRSNQWLTSERTVSSPVECFRLN